MRPITEPWGRCDDSSGVVGDVYRLRAVKPFVEYARACKDKRRISKLLVKLCKKDDYGVRDALIEKASAYLDEAEIRFMIGQFQSLSDKGDGRYSKGHFLLIMASLARQIKDAPLFEKYRGEFAGRPSTACLIEIGRVYFECGDWETAKERLDRIPSKETFHQDKRNQLYMDIYRHVGDRENLIQMLHQEFQRRQSLPALEALLAEVGEEEREKILTPEIETIMAHPYFDSSHAAFLLAVDRIQEANTYILERGDQVDGLYYESLLDLIPKLEALELKSAVTLFYRKLLDSILERARTKTYSHGVKYLIKLDQMAGETSTWEDMEPHWAYVEKLHKHHGRKKSFWAKYQAKAK